MNQRFNMKKLIKEMLNDRHTLVIVHENNHDTKIDFTKVLWDTKRRCTFRIA